MLLLFAYYSYLRFCSSPSTSSSSSSSSDSLLFTPASVDWPSLTAACLLDKERLCWQQIVEEGDSWIRFTNSD